MTIISADGDSESTEPCREKDVVGLVEDVVLEGPTGKKVKVRALFDTGATRTSVDTKLAKKLELGPIKGEVLVKSKTEKYVKRIIVPCTVEVRGRRFKRDVNIASRKGMFTPVLIGRDIIHGNFIVDPELSHNSQKLEDMKKDYRKAASSSRKGGSK